MITVFAKRCPTLRAGRAECTEVRDATQKWTGGVEKSIEKCKEKNMPDYIPDYNDLYAAHERRQERALRKYPICACCDERITDDYLFDFDGVFYCKTQTNIREDIKAQG